MKTDTQKAVVQFYVEPDGTILAYFPRTLHNAMSMTCYAHIGQHSQAAPEYVRKLKKATPEQYADLKAELESIGYNLTVKP